MPVPVMAIAALAATAVKAGSAYSQNRQAKRAAERLAANRPFLPESTAARDQQALAESELTRESRAADQYYNETNRNFANSLDTIMKTGGDVNDVGALFDGSDVGYQRARMMSENVRLNNVQNVVRAWNNTDNQRQQQFQFNQWAPWADQSQANAKLMQQSANNMWGAVDDGIGIGLRYAGSGNKETGDGGSADTSMPVNSSMPNAYNTGGYGVPSLASRYNTIDPNALNNRFNGG